MFVPTWKVESLAFKSRKMFSKEKAFPPMYVTDRKIEIELLHLQFTAFTSLSIKFPSFHHM